MVGLNYKTKKEHTAISRKKSSTEADHILKSKFAASDKSYAAPISCREDTVPPEFGAAGDLDGEEARHPGADLGGVGGLRFDNSAR